MASGQPWHRQGDLCTKGWRGIGEQREGRRNEEADKNEARRNEQEMRRSDEEMRRGNGVQMRRREEGDGRMEGGMAKGRKD